MSFHYKRKHGWLPLNLLTPVDFVAGRALIV